MVDSTKKLALIPVHSKVAPIPVPSLHHAAVDASTSSLMQPCRHPLQHPCPHKRPSLHTPPPLCLAERVRAPNQGRRSNCVVFNDPHVRTFSGRCFVCNTVGTMVLLDNEHFNITAQTYPVYWGWSRQVRGKVQAAFQRLCRVTCQAIGWQTPYSACLLCSWWPH